MHASLLRPPLPWTFSLTDTRGNVSASRIDLVLANRSALPMLRSAAVLSGIQHGGHCPVLVTLRVDNPISITWQRPRPQPPPLLRLSFVELNASPEWQALLQCWSTSPEATLALDPAAPHSLQSLSQAMLAALQHLVALAGGWQLRPPVRRSAYDSTAARALRTELILLRRLQSLVQRQQPLSPGPWPHPWMQLL